MAQVDTNRKSEDGKKKAEKQQLVKIWDSVDEDGRCLSSGRVAGLPPWSPLSLLSSSARSVLSHLGRCSGVLDREELRKVMLRMGKKVRVTRPLFPAGASCVWAEQGLSIVDRGPPWDRRLTCSAREQNLFAIRPPAIHLESGR